jgi:hypothetical protein
MGSYWENLKARRSDPYIQSMCLENDCSTNYTLGVKVGEGAVVLKSSFLANIKGYILQ